MIEIDLPSFDEPIMVVNIAHLDEIIEERFENQPHDHRSKEYKKWAKDQVKLLELANKEAGFKRYNVNI